MLPEPPGIWGGGNEPFPTPPINLPDRPVDPGAHPEHPIYWPPTIWPDPPEGLPSFDPSQIPDHADLPDLNHGAWYWVVANGALTRAFITQMYYVSADPPDYQPSLPPAETHPGKWVVALLGVVPNWAWIPSAPAPVEPPPVDPEEPEEPGEPDDKKGLFRR